MSAVRCPQCKLPLTDEEADRGSCTSCGHALPRTEAPDPIAKHAPTVAHDPTIPWLLAGVAVLLAVVAVAWGWSRGGGHGGGAEVEDVAGPAKIAKLEADLESVRTHEAELLDKLRAVEVRETQIRSDREAALFDTTKAKTELDRTSKDAKELESKLLAAWAEIDQLKKEAKLMREALAGKADFMQPGVVREIREGPNDKKLVLSAPRGEYTVDRVTGGSRLKISGAVKKLVVQGVEGGSVLDASAGLTVEEVRVLGPINGGSIFKLVCPGASVEIGRIDGNSEAVVKVSGGKVTVAEVVGDSKVTATAKEFVLKNFADGGKTLLSVTLTREGHLSFAELRGNSKLIVQKFDRGDPDVRIEVGKVGPNASFKKLAF